MDARSALLYVSLLFSCASCASVDFEPTGESRGSFRSSALAFTLLGKDYPQSAVLLARANASDSQLPNLVVEREQIFPYLWKLDFLLDIICVRYATVTGTYGPVAGTTSRDAR